MTLRSKKAAISVVLGISMAISAHSECQAQRTMQFRKHITADAVSGFTSKSDFGGGVAFGGYLLKGYWNTEITAIPLSVHLSTGDRMRYMQITATGEYLYRILTVRSRAFSLYGGGGVFLGWEFYDPMRKLPEEIDIGIADGTFLYGVRPRIETEVFFCRNAALVIGTSIPVNLSSPVRKYHIELTAGIRLNI